MSDELTELSSYREAFERLRHSPPGANEYLLARDIHHALGYPVWDKFEPVIEKASQSLISNGVDPSQHIALTSKLMEVHNGGMRRGIDYYLSRLACYLISMNGDPTKPEIAAAQAYFAIQTRRQELEDHDTKRLRLRDKVSQAHRLVSGVAQEAGVRSTMQGVFHDARVKGLYGLSLKDLKVKRGLGEKEQLFDRAGALELSANEFQMNLAAALISDEKIKGEQAAINKNREVAKNIRQSMANSGKMMPESLPLERPIRELKKKVAGKNDS